jgi:6,7-dimethyl-8-ribityllumazine synthase
VVSNRGRAAKQPKADAASLRVAIVLSDYHRALGEGLLRGALGGFEARGLPADAVPVFRVPGAFEIPQAVSRLLAGSEGRPDAVVALGVLLRGETIHFELLAREVCGALGDIGRSTGVPVAFGVLTVNNEGQARDRSGPGRANKGWEAADAAIDMALLFRGLERSEAARRAAATGRVSRSRRE